MPLGARGLVLGWVFVGDAGLLVLSGSACYGVPRGPNWLEHGSSESSSPCHISCPSLHTVGFHVCLCISESAGAARAPVAVFRGAPPLKGS